MNKVEWKTKPCEPGTHDERLGEYYAVCMTCGSVRTNELGINYGKRSSRKYYYKWAVDSLGTSYLVECDKTDPERIR
jgi:hypothetical protein